MRQIGNALSIFLGLGFPAYLIVVGQGSWDRLGFLDLVVFADRSDSSDRLGFWGPAGLSDRLDFLDLVDFADRSDSLDHSGFWGHLGTP